VTAEFLKEVTDLCRRHGALLYADDVVSRAAVVQRDGLTFDL